MRKRVAVTCFTCFTVITQVTSRNRSMHVTPTWLPIRNVKHVITACTLLPVLRITHGGSLQGAFSSGRVIFPYPFSSSARKGSPAGSAMRNMRITPPGTPSHVHHPWVHPYTRYPTRATPNTGIATSAGKDAPAMGFRQSHAKLPYSGKHAVRFTIIHDAYYLKRVIYSCATKCGKTFGGIALHASPQPVSLATR